MTTAWTQLADAYAQAINKPDSLDRLLDWPAQKRLLGDVSGKRVLDLGCGNGYKSLAMAEQGAAAVVGVDISKPFIDDLRARDLPEHIQFEVGDVNDLAGLDCLVADSFDLVTCFQAVGYADDPVGFFTAIRALLAPDGVFLLTRSHPFRFAVEKADRFGTGLGSAYHDHRPHSYPSGWDPSVTLTHRVATFSDTHNDLVEAGFWVEHVEEPQLTIEQKEQFPHKQEWMDKYVGAIHFRARAR